MIPEKNGKNVIVTMLRGIILFAGLIMAGLYGMEGEWAAATAGLLAAGIAFFCKGKKG